MNNAEVKKNADKLVNGFLLLGLFVELTKETNHTQCRIVKECLINPKMKGFIQTILNNPNLKTINGNNKNLQLLSQVTKNTSLKDIKEITLALAKDLK